MNKNDPSVFLYHKFIIIGFVNCKSWGQHPSSLKLLTGLKSLIGSELYYSSTRSSPAQYPLGSLSGGKCFVQYLNSFQNPYRMPSGILAPNTKLSIMVPNFQQFCIWVMYRIHWISLDSVQITGKSSKELKDLAQ